MNRPLFVPLAFAPLFVAVVAVVIPITPAQAQTPVRSARVKRENVQHRHAVTGSVRAVARGDLAALESGRLIELIPKAGHFVSQGDVLARVDARRLQAQKKEAEASLAVAKADLVSRKAMSQKASADLKRAEQLIQKNAVSRQEFDLAQAEHRVALANIESGEKQIDMLRESISLIDVRLSDTVVRAPYDATVIQRHAEPGDWVRPGDPLLTLVSTGAVEAWLEVPERYIEALHAFGDQVVVRARATSEDSEVLSTRRISDVNRRVRTIRFVATLDNPNGLLTPGMSVDAWIAVTGNTPRLTVPKDAVIRDNGAAYVFRIDENRNAEKVPIQVEFETSRQVALAATRLQDGDEIVIEGNERLAPGQPLVVSNHLEPTDAIAKR